MGCQWRCAVTRDSDRMFNEVFATGDSAARREPVDPERTRSDRLFAEVFGVAPPAKAPPGGFEMTTPGDGFNETASRSPVVDYETGVDSAVRRNFGFVKDEGPQAAYKFLADTYGTENVKFERNKDGEIRNWFVRDDITGPWKIVDPPGIDRGDFAEGIGMAASALPGIAGGVIGGMLGGPPGAIGGGLLGDVAGSLADSAITNELQPGTVSGGEAAARAGVAGAVGVAVPAAVGAGRKVLGKIFLPGEDALAASLAKTIPTSTPLRDEAGELVLDYSDNPIMRAGKEQIGEGQKLSTETGIPLSVAQTIGTEEAMRWEAAQARNNPFSGNFSTFYEKQRQILRRKVGELVSRVGGDVPTKEAGEKLSSTYTDHIEQLRKAGNAEFKRLYDSAVESSGDAPVIPTRHLEELVSELEETRAFRFNAESVEGKARELINALVSNGEPGEVAAKESASAPEGFVPTDQQKRLGFKGSRYATSWNGPEITQDKDEIRQALLSGIDVYRGRPSGAGSSEMLHDVGNYGPGSYYTTDPETALYYARNQSDGVTRHKAKLSNPLVLTVDEAHRLARQFGTIDSEGASLMTEEAATGADKLADHIRSMGHDGVVVVHRKSIEVMTPGQFGIAAPTEEAGIPSRRPLTIREMQLALESAQGVSGATRRLQSPDRNPLATDKGSRKSGARILNALKADLRDAATESEPARQLLAARTARAVAGAAEREAQDAVLEKFITTAAERRSPALVIRRIAKEQDEAVVTRILGLMEKVDSTGDTSRAIRGALLRDILERKGREQAIEQTGEAATSGITAAKLVSLSNERRRVIAAIFGEKSTELAEWNRFVAVARRIAALDKVRGGSMTTDKAIESTLHRGVDSIFGVTMGKLAGSLSKSPVIREALAGLRELVTNSDKLATAAIDGRATRILRQLADPPKAWGAMEIARAYARFAKIAHDNQVAIEQSRYWAPSGDEGNQE